MAAPNTQPQHIPPKSLADVPLRIAFVALPQEWQQTQSRRAIFGQKRPKISKVPFSFFTHSEKLYLLNKKNDQAQKGEVELICDVIQLDLISLPTQTMVL